MCDEHEEAQGHGEQLPRGGNLSRYKFMKEVGSFEYIGSIVPTEEAYRCPKNWGTIEEKTRKASDDEAVQLQRQPGDRA